MDKTAKLIFWQRVTILFMSLSLFLCVARLWDLQPAPDNDKARGPQSPCRVSELLGRGFVFRACAAIVSVYAACLAASLCRRFRRTRPSRSGPLPVSARAMLPGSGAATPPAGAV